jgi:hypothetical protein
MMSVIEESAITSSELQYDLDEIREIEAYFLYYQSTGVQVRQAKQLYDILYKEL